MDPNLPTDRFYNELGDFLERVDSYRHLRTTSTWAPSAKDCRHPKLDLADVHFYLRPADKGRLRDEVDAVLERTRWLRAQAPSKPVHLGEFGLADDQWRITSEMKQSPELADVHSALWAAALSGASGTALPWWWERLDQRQGYAVYRGLSAFIRDVPWTSGLIQPLTVSPSDSRVTAVGLQAAERGWLWLFNHEASWSSIVLQKNTPRSVEGLTIRIDGLPPGTHSVRWWDTREAEVLREERISSLDGSVRLTPPPFSRDIACKIDP